MNEDERDPVDRFLASMRREMPADLEPRIFASLHDPAAARRLRWDQLGDLSRRAFAGAGIAFLIAAMSLGVILAREDRGGPALAPTPASLKTSSEPLVSLVIPIEARFSGSVWREAR